MLKKIVSGGQTGADRAGLDVAEELGLPRGGWCPRRRRRCLEPRALGAASPRAGDARFSAGVAVRLLAGALPLPARRGSAGLLHAVCGTGRRRAGPVGRRVPRNATDRPDRPQLAKRLAAVFLAMELDSLPSSNDVGARFGRAAPSGAAPAPEGEDMATARECGAVQEGPNMP